jgi:hypothetical protein
MYMQTLPLRSTGAYKVRSERIGDGHRDAYMMDSLPAWTALLEYQGPVAFIWGSSI